MLNARYRDHWRTAHLPVIQLRLFFHSQTQTLHLSSLLTSAKSHIGVKPSRTDLISKRGLAVPSNFHRIIDIMTLKEVLLAKIWFEIDLDDTLHEFRKASAAAIATVFLIIQSQDGVETPLLQSSYGQILRPATSSAFTDGKTSTEYRKERFSALLDEFQVEYSDEFINALAEQYKSSLRSALTLKPGALELLRYLKETEKDVIVITEGPADAQKWTIHELGLERYIDILVTNNEIGKSKVMASWLRSFAYTTSRLRTWSTSATTKQEISFLRCRPISWLFITMKLSRAK